jgi:hypothetical protein
MLSFVLRADRVIPLHLDGRSHTHVGGNKEFYWRAILVPCTEVLKSPIPFIAVVLIILVLVTYVPVLVTWLFGLGKNEFSLIYGRFKMIESGVDSIKSAVVAIGYQLVSKSFYYVSIRRYSGETGGQQQGVYGKLPGPEYSNYSLSYGLTGRQRDPV